MSDKLANTVTARLPHQSWSTLRRAVAKFGDGLALPPWPGTEGDTFALTLAAADMHVVISALHQSSVRNPIVVDEQDKVSGDPEVQAEAWSMTTLNEFDEKNHYRCRLLANILKLETVLQTGTKRYRRGTDSSCTKYPNMYWDDREEGPLARLWF